MSTWLAGAWSSIWPNLVADALWVPVVAASHLLLRRHLTRLHQQHAARIERAINARKDPA